MTFPTIPTGGRVLTVLQANTTTTRTFPNLSSLTKNAGDLLIAIGVCYSGSTVPQWGSWGGGFTEFYDSPSAGAIQVGAAWKISTGSETGTFTAVASNSSAGHFVGILLSIPLAHASSAPEAGGSHVITGGTADPSTLSPSWGAADTLWINLGASGETNTTGSWTSITGSPANYGSFVDTGQTADVVGGVHARLGFRQLNTSGEDPPAFTYDTSNTRSGAFVIAIRPAGGSVSGTGSADFGFTGTAAGVPETFGQATASFGFTGTAAGTPRVQGQASASFGFTGTASGEAGAPPVTGVATASFGFTGTAQGIDRALGQATATFGYTGTAQGLPRHVGQALATFGFTGQALGQPRTFGAAIATFGYTGTAAGRPRHVGQAVALLGFTGAGAGVDRALGQAVALLGFTGQAAGTIGDTPVTGVATATFGFTGTAAGVDRAIGQAAASFGFSGAAAGVDRALGVAVATFTFTGTAQGRPRVIGHAIALLGFTAEAAGGTGAEPDPDPVTLTIIELGFRATAWPLLAQATVQEDARATVQDTSTATVQDHPDTLATAREQA